MAARGSSSECRAVRRPLPLAGAGRCRRDAGLRLYRPGSAHTRADRRLGARARERGCADRAGRRGRPMRQPVATPPSAGVSGAAGIGAYDAATGAPSGAGVYLLAFLAPDGHGGWTHKPYRHAAHYLGWSASISARLAEHVAGRGARLVQVVIAAGYRVQLVRTWQ